MHVRTWGALGCVVHRCGKTSKLPWGILREASKPQTPNFLAGLSIFMHSDRSSEREGDFPEVTQQDSSRAGLGSWALGVPVSSLNSQGTLRGRQGLETQGWARATQEYRAAPAYPLISRPQNGLFSSEEQSVPLGTAESLGWGL